MIHVNRIHRDFLIEWMYVRCLWQVEKKPFEGGGRTSERRCGEADGVSFWKSWFEDVFISNSGCGFWVSLLFGQFKKETAEDLVLRAYKQNPGPKIRFWKGGRRFNLDRGENTSNTHSQKGGPAFKKNIQFVPIQKNSTCEPCNTFRVKAECLNLEMVKRGHIPLGSQLHLGVGAEMVYFGLIRTTFSGTTQSLNRFEPAQVFKK